MFLNNWSLAKIVLVAVHPVFCHEFHELDELFTVFFVKFV